MLKRQREYPDFFATYAELEPTATNIEEYAARLVPGLLQTPAYARAVIRSGQPYTPEEKIEEMVQAQIKRACTLENPASVQLWEILDEASSASRDSNASRCASSWSTSRI